MPKAEYVAKYTVYPKMPGEPNIQLPTYKETQPSSIAANSYLQIVITKQSEVSNDFKLQAELIPNYQEGKEKYTRS